MTLSHPVARIGFVALLAFGALIALEVSQDFDQMTLARLVLELAETGLLVAAIVATAIVSVEARRHREERAALEQDLQRARARGQQWRDEARAHVEGLSVAIRRQFESWRLTEAEQDVGLLMLKGLSHKEIAHLRQTGESTVRQQARSIYEKAGLSGRSGLSAYFLEDLLAPRPADPAGNDASDGS